MFIRCVNLVRRFCSIAHKTEIMKFLCVAEKNDAAKTISGFLSRGRSQRREGFSQFNKIYEFEMDLRGQLVKIVFTSVSGHLLTFEFSSAYRNWTSCDPEQLFDAPVIKTCPENFQKIKKTLEREVRTCNGGLIIWTDCDREGENIGYEIIDVCRAIRPNIPVQRAKFSDMTAASLSRAMNNLIQPDERVSNAVDVRSELDLRIGAAFTRFQTLRLQNVFPDNINDIVSYGSCQIPTLGFVAQRYKEIENFITRPFWKIKLTHKIDQLTVEFNWARNRLFEKPSCEALLMMCQTVGEANVTNVQQKPKSKWRPQPMDTIELEKTGSRKLKLSAKTIMTIAEKLYTQGFISYPRTETNKFSPDINLRPLVEMQVPHPEWGEFASRVLEWGTNPRNGNKSDQAHPPIHPTKFVATLQGDEKRVYELVVRHFLACVSRDAVGSETIVNATVGEEEFTATGLVILERNYLDVYPYDRWTGKEIHNYEPGTSFTPTELCLHEGSTNPPAMLTEADLIAMMEKHGIGTDATHAEHIAKIKEREYIGEVDQGHLVPGTLGMGLVEGYELMNLELSQPRLRAGLEEDLKAICQGRKNPRDVLAEQIEKYKECYRIISREALALDRALGQRFGQEPQAAPQVQLPTIRELFKCPKCRTGGMSVRQKKDGSGYFISCQGYPECRNAVWLSNGVKEIQALDETCTACGGANKKVKLKFSQVSMLGMVREVPAYSRIEGTHYITCLVCDASVRELLEIPVENVKVLGNIVGASTRPVQQNQRGNQQPPRRGFGTNPNRPRGWNDEDDDDDRPAGGGAVAAVGNNTSNNSGGGDQRRGNNPGADGPSNSRIRGWNTTAASAEPSSSSINRNRGSGSGFDADGPSINRSREWNTTAAPAEPSNNLSNENRGWGSSSDAPGPSSSGNRGWNNNSHTAGASSSSINANQRWSNGSDPAGPFNNQNRGWNTTAAPAEPSSSFSNGNRGWGNGDDAAGPSSSVNRGWNNNSNTNGPSSSSFSDNRGWNNNSHSAGPSGSSTNRNPAFSNAAAPSAAKKPPVNLNKLPNLNCKCNKQAAKFVTKQGANIGRPFYRCASNACKFFQWADVPLASNQQSTNGDSGNKRKCGVCRMEGHNKKNCPNVTNR